jgi:hypothetical protein
LTPTGSKLIVILAPVSDQLWLRALCAYEPS